MTAQVGRHHTTPFAEGPLGQGFRVDQPLSAWAVDLFGSVCVLVMLALGSLFVAALIAFPVFLLVDVLPEGLRPWGGKLAGILAFSGVLALWARALPAVWTAAVRTVVFEADHMRVGRLLPRRVP